MNSVFEPLAHSAELASVHAPELCYRDAHSGESCLDYHRIWQYLRLLGIITTVRSDADFLRSTLRPLLHTDACRHILISGTADYGLLAQIGALVQAERAMVAITVLDRCQTPLYLNDWYAQQTGLTITTVAADIFTYTPAAPFDLICTHSFLSRFDPAGRTALVRHWHSLLRPGGRVLTTNRVRPEAGAAQIGYTPAQIAALRAEVLQAARRLPHQLTVPPETLADWTESYARQHYRYPLRSLDELQTLFGDHGFRSEHLSLAAAAERQHDRATGPADPSSGRARLVAVRES